MYAVRCRLRRITNGSYNTNRANSGTEPVADYALLEMTDVNDARKVLTHLSEKLRRARGALYPVTGGAMVDWATLRQALGVEGRPPECDVYLQPLNGAIHDPQQFAVCS